MDDEQLSAHIVGAVDAAMDDDIDGICDHLDPIADEHDPKLMFAACCGFAEIAKRAMIELYGDAPDLENGGMWAAIPGPNLTPEKAADNPAGLFSMRFIIAYANNDPETPPALYRAALEAGPEQFTDSVLHLVCDTANLMSATEEVTA